jgi:hypothetical protein
VQPVFLIHDGKRKGTKAVAFQNDDSQKPNWRHLIGFHGFPIQLIVLVGCWIYMIRLHWSNDGLFFQGDSPRHAMNGIFWGDLLREGLSDPIGYTKSYYARYPAITPTRYPPVFYFLEAAAFELFGNSSFVAKGLVQLFALAMGVYLLLAMRRWISSGSGMFACLLFLMPGMVTWSNAVMLNVPAAAFALISLYYARCGIESNTEAQTSKWLSIAIILTTFSIATHPTVGYSALIMFAWVLLNAKLRAFFKLRLGIVSLACLIFLTILFLCIRVLGPEQLSQANLVTRGFSFSRRLGFYTRALPGIVTWWGLLVGLLCAVLAWTEPRLRLDVKHLGVAFLIGYTVLTPIWAVDERYALLACPAWTYILGLGFTRLDYLFVVPVRRFPFATTSMIGLIALGFGYVASDGQMFLRNTATIESVVDYVESIAPDEAVLYHGRFDGVFVYYMRARDLGFARQVVLPRKWVNPDLDQERLRQDLLESGCRWLIIEKPKTWSSKPDEMLFQRVVQSDGFALVKTFELLPRSIEGIEIYRLSSTVLQNDNSHARRIEVKIEGVFVPPIER